MNKRSDQEWIRLLKQDDPEAVEDLWMMLFAVSTNYVRLRYQGSDKEDLAHEAAIKAYERIRTRGVHQFRFQCSFRWYCRQIVSHEVWRLVGKFPPPTSELDEELAADADDQPPPNPAGLSALLQPCLDQLAARDGAVIDLLYSQSLSPQQAADRLKVSRNNVNVIAHRARRKLRGCLQDRGYNSIDDVWSEL